MGLLSKNTATASPDGSAPAEGKGFFGRAMRDAIGQIKAQGGFSPRFDSGISSTSKPALKLDLVDDKFEGMSLKKGGTVKTKSKVSSASKRADGCAVRGKTRGRNI